MQARNAYGYSAMSDAVSILASSLPTEPRSLLNNNLITAAGQIGLQWLNPISAGGSPI